MLFQASALVLLGLATPSLAQDDQCSTTWKCKPTTKPPVLDADHSEWADVEAYTTSLIMTSGSPYEAGDASYKCLYDDAHIYFAFEIPGEYRFSTEDNHLCAAIATMMKIGEKATYLNMGGCPDAMGGCDDGVPDTCADYRVDIGGHWELKGTEQNTFYDVGSSVTAVDRETGNNTEPAGNDLIANKDDEYSVSPYCRFDDDDAAADNEWAGAWAHTNPTEGEFGTYHFEMSRLLKTASSVSDAQLAPGETIQFGVAFWDPYEMEETGWTHIGHYLTGCGTRWIDLELVAEDDHAHDEGEDHDHSSDSDDTPVPESTESSGAASVSVAALALTFAAFGL